MVCAVRGWAAGLGCQLALAADFTDRRPRTAGSGCRSPSGASRRTAAPRGSLPRLVGVARAKELLLLGRPVTGREAADWGMIHRAVPERRARRRRSRSSSAELAAAADRRPRPHQALHPRAPSTAASPRRWRREAMALELSSRTADFREGLAGLPGAPRPARSKVARRSSMEFETILYEVDGPHRHDHASTGPTSSTRSARRWSASCATAYAAAEADDDVWTILVTGNGRAFCAGADVDRDPRRRPGRLRGAVPLDLSRSGRRRRRARRRSAR